MSYNWNDPRLVRETLKKGDEGEDLVASFFRRNGSLVITGADQLITKPPFDLSIQTSEGSVYNIEIKSNHGKGYETFFLESWVEEGKRRPEWIDHDEVDLLIVVNLSNKKGYIYSAHHLRKVILTEEAQRLGRIYYSYGCPGYLIPWDGGPGFLCEIDLMKYSYRRGVRDETKNETFVARNI